MRSAALAFAIFAFSVAPDRVAAGERARMSIEINDAARVVFSFERRGSKRWVLVRSVRRRLAAGQHDVLTPRDLPAARYRITATAWDAGGNRAAPLWTRLRVG